MHQQPPRHYGGGKATACMSRGPRPTGPKCCFACFFPTLVRNTSALQPSLELESCSPHFAMCIWPLKYIFSQKHIQEHFHVFRFSKKGHVQPASYASQRIPHHKYGGPDERSQMSSEFHIYSPKSCHISCYVTLSCKAYLHTYSALKSMTNLQSWVLVFLC